jgi:hypothetical protein
MSKTFKKSMYEDYDNQSHFYRFRKSREDRDEYKNIDKYLKQQKFNEIEDEDEREYR